MSRRYRVSHGDDELTAAIAGDGLVDVDGRRFRVEGAGPGRYRVLDADGHAEIVALAGSAGAPWAVSLGRALELSVDGSPQRRLGSRAAEQPMAAPMPATVVKVLVSPGDHVSSGDPVVVLEAMKMELTIRATRTGVVRAVRCSAGELVAPGTPLVEIDG